MKKIKAIKFPAKDLRVGDVVLINSKPRKVLGISIYVYEIEGGQRFQVVGLVDLVSRATTSEQTYIQYRNKVWTLLKEQGVSRKHLPGFKFIRPCFNIGAGPDECAANYLNQVQYPEI